MSFGLDAPAIYGDAVSLVLQRKAFNGIVSNATLLGNISANGQDYLRSMCLRNPASSGKTLVLSRFFARSLTPMTARLGLGDDSSPAYAIAESGDLQGRSQYLNSTNVANLRTGVGIFSVGVTNGYPANVINNNIDRYPDFVYLDMDFAQNPYVLTPGISLTVIFQMYALDSTLSGSNGLGCVAMQTCGMYWLEI